MTMTTKFTSFGILICKYQNDLITSECWMFKLTLSCDTCNDLMGLQIQGLGLEKWLKELFHQKVLTTEETEITKKWENVLYIQDLSDEYVVSIVKQILESNLQEGIVIDNIDLTKFD